MEKNIRINRSATTGQFVSKAIGSSKATKFLAVEGMALSAESSQALRRYKSEGLAGDALRSAITKRFQKNNCA
jgi:hypothetical protein